MPHDSSQAVCEHCGIDHSLSPATTWAPAPAAPAEYYNPTVTPEPIESAPQPEPAADPQFEVPIPADAAEAALYQPFLLPPPVPAEAAPAQIQQVSWVQPQWVPSSSKRTKKTPEIRPYLTGTRPLRD